MEETRRVTHEMATQTDVPGVISAVQVVPESLSVATQVRPRHTAGSHPVAKFTICKLL